MDPLVETRSVVNRRGNTSVQRNARNSQPRSAPILNYRRQTVDVSCQTDNECNLQPRAAPILNNRRQTINASCQTDNDDDDIWCICRGRDDGERMIFCEHPRCLIQWFHCACVGLHAVPSGRWYCSNCSLLRNRRHN